MKENERGESNLLIWKTIYPELFTSCFISIVLLSPISARCPTRGELITFIVDTTLPSFRVTHSAGGGSGCNILAIFCTTPGQQQSAKPQGWVAEQVPVAPGRGRAVQTAAGFTTCLTRSSRSDCASLDSHATPKTPKKRPEGE